MHRNPTNEDKEDPVIPTCFDFFFSVHLLPLTPPPKPLNQASFAECSFPSQPPLKFARIVYIDVDIEESTIRLASSPRLMSCDWLLEMNQIWIIKGAEPNSQAQHFFISLSDHI